MSADLAIAATVQQAILSRDAYADERLQISGRVQPMVEVGGDYFEIFRFDSGESDYSSQMSRAMARVLHSSPRCSRSVSKTPRTEKVTREEFSAALTTICAALSARPIFT